MLQAFRTTALLKRDSNTGVFQHNFLRTAILKNIWKRLLLYLRDFSEQLVFREVIFQSSFLKVSSLKPKGNDQSTKNNQQQAKSNEQRVRSNEQLAKSNKQWAKSNEEQEKSNEQRAKNNEQRAKSNEQRATSEKLHLKV